MKNILFLLLLISNLFSSNHFVLNTYNFPPYVENKNGFVIDIIKELFKKSNLSYTIKTLPQTRAIRTARTNKNNVVTPIQRSQEEEVNFKWVGPILITQTALFTLENSDIKIDVLKDIGTNKILVIRNSAEEKYLKGFKFSTQTAKNDLLNIKKLQANRAPIWAADTISASYSSKQSKISLKKHLIFFTTLRALAFNINTSDETIELLNNNLHEMYKDGTIKKILQKYSKTYNIQDILKFLE